MRYLIAFLLLSLTLHAQNSFERAFQCTAASSSGTAYTCSFPVNPTAYVSGKTYQFKADVANTGSATINFNSIGALTIKKVTGGVTTDLVANDIRAGQWVIGKYDGTNFQMTSMLGNAGGSSSSFDPIDPTIFSYKENFCTGQGYDSSHLGVNQLIVANAGGSQAFQVTGSASPMCTVASTTAAGAASGVYVAYAAVGKPFITLNTRTNITAYCSLAMDNVTDARMQCGFTSSLDPYYTWDINSIVVKYDTITSDGGWIFRTCASSACSVTAAGSPPVAGTTAHIKIWSTVSGTWHASVNGTELGTGLSANLPSVAMYFGMQGGHSGTTARIFYSLYQAVSMTGLSAY